MHKTFWNVVLTFAGATVFAAAPNPVAPAAETSPSGAAPSQTIEATAPAGRPGRLLGGVELRPSYASQKGTVHSENYAQLGWQFPSGVQLLYR